LEYINKALSINQKLGNKSGIAGNLSSIGKIYLKQGDLNRSLEFFNNALKINRELNINSSIGDNVGSIGELLLKKAMDSVINPNRYSNEPILNKKSNIKLAIENILQAIDIFKTSGELHNQSKQLLVLSDAYVMNENYQSAYQTYKEYKNLQDSIFTIEKQKQISNLEAKRELEIKEKENQLLIKNNELINAKLMQNNQKLTLTEKEKQIQHLAYLKEQAENQDKMNKLNLAEADLKINKSNLQLLEEEKARQIAEIYNQNLQKYFFIAGLIAVILLLIILYSRFKEKKKLSDKLFFQNQEIEKQKLMVENQKEILQEKNEEIYSSINYAATIQHAILPWDSIIKTAFSDILIYYKPKDIVSGDSYWFQEVDGIKYLAVIDCTGHGIPGAMLTVIASTALDDAVLGKRLSDTGQILTYMNEKVTEVLNQKLAENKIRDGMEVGLIAFQKDKIQFSGAGRPLYLKNGTMEIIKTDKRGIAGSTEEKDYKFSSIEFDTSKKLMLYLASDGFADQMNEQSKKYSTKRFTNLLESISVKPLAEQSNILENEFNTHRGNREQIDDITILGVRV
jgi:serine phosphatase RsbU (regulator of sigma subunit)